MGYHNTFGMTGGYANMAWNYGFQSYSTGNWGVGNKDLISLGLSSVTKTTTPIWQQSLIGASGAVVQYTPNGGLSVMEGSSGYILGSAANGALGPKLSNSRFGNNLSSNLVFGTSQLMMNLLEKGEKFNK